MFVKNRDYDPNYGHESQLAQVAAKAAYDAGGYDGVFASSFTSCCHSSGEHPAGNAIDVSRFGYASFGSDHFLTVETAPRFVNMGFAGSVLSNPMLPRGAQLLGPYGMGWIKGGSGWKPMNVSEGLAAEHANHFHIGWTWH
jgi:hypothetical protein